MPRITNFQLPFKWFDRKKRKKLNEEKVLNMDHKHKKQYNTDS